jgi:hypothetical protein
MHNVTYNTVCESVILDRHRPEKTSVTTQGVCATLAEQLA